MKKLNFILLILLIGIFSTSCSAKRYKNTAYKGVMPGMNQSSETYFYQPDRQSSIQERVFKTKVIKNAYMSISVENLDSTSNQISKLTKSYNGYISQIGTDKAIVRIKTEKIEEFVSDISNLGRVDRKNIHAQDVTDEFLDFQIRLDNALKARERYLQLLAKAENVEAALKVEKELERLNEKVDMLKGKINRIDHLSEFSTITINISERKKPGIIGYIGIGLYHSVKWLFVRN